MSDRAVFRRWESSHVEGRPEQAGYGFRCPGCNERHAIATEGGAPGRRWTFNGDVLRPVVSPSVLVTGARFVSDDSDEQVPMRCHSFIGCNGAQPGQIIFLGDCTHALAGQTVDLPPLETP